MRRPNRELNIFSISALDLFASAMGAFILIAVILFPFYLKNHEVVAERDQARQELAETQQRLDEAERRRDEAEARAAAAAEEAGRLRRRNAELERQAQQTATVAMLGINSRAKSFVVLIDMSESMHAYTRLMIDTLQRLLEPMEPAIRVQIIGFSAPNNVPRLIQWQPGITLMSMTPAAKQNALAYARDMAQRFAGGTPTHDVLREALKYPAQAIILLSDGAPTDSPIPAILDDVTRNNGGRMEINTVAIGDYNKHPSLVYFLQSLARRNRGGFTGVSG